jgi:hypothetical protein
VEPDSSSPFARRGRKASDADGPAAGGLDDEFLSESDDTAAPEDSLAAFGSESGPDLFQAESRAAAAAKPAARAAAAVPHDTATRDALAPPPRVRLKWARTPAFSIGPIWLFAAAIGGLFAGLGYAWYVRPVPAAASIPSVTESPRAAVPSEPGPRPATAAPPSQPPGASKTDSSPAAAATPPARSPDAPARSNVPAANRTKPQPTATATGEEPPSSVPARPSGAFSSEALTPSAIATLPHVPAVLPPAQPGPPPEPREESEGARDQRLIRSLLEAYRSAYERLDPLAVAALWPGVDSRAVTRAFGTLSAQRMTFDRCEITITGVVAVARCDGTLAYSRSVGETDPQSRQMSWAFALERGSGQWRISGVNSR